MRGRFSFHGKFLPLLLVIGFQPAPPAAVYPGADKPVQQVNGENHRGITHGNLKMQITVRTMNTIAYIVPRVRMLICLKLG